MIVLCSAGAARSDGLARQAGREVDDWFVGDGERGVGIESEGGVGVKCSVDALFRRGLLAEHGYTRAAVSVRVRECSDASEPLNCR